jgi:DNA-binding LacI/PurR family transcriptional regulator
MSRLLAQGRDRMVVCASDALALGAIRAAAKRRGLGAAGGACPWSASTTRRTWPVVEAPLTTVRQPVRAMGAAAVTLLDAQIKRARACPAEELLLERRS